MRKALQALSIAGIAAVALAVPANAASQFRPFYHQKGVWNHHVGKEFPKSGRRSYEAGGYLGGPAYRAPAYGDEPEYDGPGFVGVAPFAPGLYVAPFAGFGFGYDRLHRHGYRRW